MGLPRAVVAIVYASVLAFVATAHAQQGALESLDQSTFGAGKWDEFSRRIEQLATGDLDRQAAAAAADIRFINSYLFLARTVGAERLSVLDDSRPRFNDAVKRAANALGQTLNALRKAGIAGELPKIKELMPRLVGDPKLLAEYMLWESEVGAPPQQTFDGLRSPRKWQGEELRRAQEIAENLPGKIESTPTKDLPKVAGGIGKLTGGGVLVLLDVWRGRKNPFRALISVTEGIDQIVEGWNDAFG